MPHHAVPKPPLGAEENPQASDKLEQGRIFVGTFGIIHPPLGIGLFVAARVARITPEQVLSATWPFFIPLFGGLLVVSAFPQLSLWLPNTVYAWLGLR